MPTSEFTQEFAREFIKLSDEDKQRFREARRKFSGDLASGTFRAGLRIKGVQGADGVFEMTWADNGRATFQYGAEVAPGQPHIAWRRIGTHDIFTRP